jgi:hypothetical protein
MIYSLKEIALFPLPHPCVDVLSCSLSSIIQAQIADDCDRYDEGAEQEDPGYLLYPIFDIPLPSLPPHCGGNIQPYEVIGDGLETMLSHEITDEELKNKIETQRVPPLMSIFRSHYPPSMYLSDHSSCCRYIVYLYSAAEYSPECNIMALVYINRLTAMNQVILTQFNWRSIWLVVIMLAQKVWDDRPLRTSDFVRLLPDIDSKILRELEYQTLTMLKYITGVKPSLYAKYYFELRTLYSDIMGSNPSCGEWALEPLSNYLASKLDMKNQKLEENRLKMMQQQHPRASAASSSSSSTPAIAGAKESGGAAGGGEFDQFKYNDKKSSSASATPPPSSSHSLSRHRDHDPK